MQNEFAPPPKGYRNPMHVDSRHAAHLTLATARMVQAQAGLLATSLPDANGNMQRFDEQTLNTLAENFHEARAGLDRALAPYIATPPHTRGE